MMTRKMMIVATFMILGAPLTAIAQSEPARAQAAASLTDGEVTKIDESAGKITIKHGPIEKLKMDSMTMVFAVQDAGKLKTVKPGDKIKFDAERINGRYTVTRIEKAK